MAKNKASHFMRCACGKRGFADEHTAEKALGRAQTKRRRCAQAHGARIENRYYFCPEGDLYHLTAQPRRQYDEFEARRSAA